MQVTVKKRKRVKHTRFPNGFGSICFLTGNRRRPYWAKKAAGKDSRGYVKYITIGYFETFEDAFVALSEYNRQPYDVDARQITFGRVAELWWKEFTETPEGGSQKAKTTLQGYKNGADKCAGILDRKIRSITSAELQELICGVSAGMQAQVKTYLNQVFRYAMKNDIVDKNPVEYVYKTKKTTPKRNPFTAEEVRKIWEMPESDIRNGALILLYTGMRPAELGTVSEIHDTYLIAGNKTPAGKWRMIPIHSKIRHLIPKMPRWKISPVAQFSALFPNHKPHDCRRTFSSRCAECKVDAVVARKVMGHKGDMHENVYTFLNDPEYLCSEIEKLSY